MIWFRPDVSRDLFCLQPECEASIRLTREPLRERRIQAEAFGWYYDRPLGDRCPAHRPIS
jgi:hypothetical protein